MNEDMRLTKLRDLARFVVDSYGETAMTEALGAYLDYLDEAEREEQAAADARNTVHIDMPKFNVSTAGTTPVNANSGPHYAGMSGADRPGWDTRSGGSH